MRRKKYKAWMLTFCLCMMPFHSSCGTFSGAAPQSTGQREREEEAPFQENGAGKQENETYYQERLSGSGESETLREEECVRQEEAGGEPAAAMAADRMAEINALAAYSIVDVANWDSASVHALFFSQEIPDEIYAQINGCSYRENDHIDLGELRYLRVLHMGFDGKTHVGELIVHQAVSKDILEIMEALYEAEYPIEKMVLVDHYDGDDERSMEDNNTSAFNYRTIAGTDTLSNHSYGTAIDINPLYNPYVKVKSDGSVLVSPESGREYADREKDFSYKIERGDLCYQLFTERGFAWGGDWNSVKDYQHFEKSVKTPIM